MDKISCQITELTKDTIKFTLSNCDVSLANALRRVMISEVPTMAVHMINIYENTSVLHDQFLTQRLALIPFNSQSVDSYKYTWQCDCTLEQKQCQTCKAYFALNVRNNNTEIMEVTSLDIQPIFQNRIEEESKQVKPILFKSDLHEDQPLGIPIVKLSQNQSINITFDVQRGIGKMHAKWSPTTIATFRPEPDVRLDEEKLSKLSDQTKRAIKESCPTNVFEYKAGVFEVTRPGNCIFCEECKKIDTPDEPNPIRICKIFVNQVKKKDRFHFLVESSGVVAPATIVKKAIQILRNKLKSLEGKIM